MPADRAAALTGALRHLRPGEVEVAPQGGAVELRGSRAVLHEATLVAIDDAGEWLSRLCTSLLRGEASPDDVSAQLEALRDLLDLL